MADLFSRTEVDFGGGFTSQFGMITPNNGLTGVLMQNMQLSYQQSVTRLYELGNSGNKTKVYYVGGRAAGSMNAGHVIGPGVSMKNFYDNFSDVCKAGTNDCEVKLTPNLCTSGAGATVTGVGAGIAGTGAAIAAAATGSDMAYKCKYCVLVSVGVSVAAQDFVVNENSQLMFSGMEFSGN